MDNQEYNRFLKKLYDILYQNNIITKVPNTTKEKVDITTEYLDKLDRISTKAYDTHFLVTLKKLYYDKYIIKEEDISKSYWRGLQNKYLEDGEGRFDLVNPSSEKDIVKRRSEYQRIRNEQRETLDAWLNYFLSPDSDYLPTWAKVWAFQGMLRIGTLNEKKDGYYKRRKDTVAPFVAIDAEVLGKSVDALIKHLSKDKNSIEEMKEPDEIVMLANTENFAHIYGTLLINKKDIKLNGNDGVWIKYVEGSDHSKLFNDLQGYNTGWCTAATIKTARKHLRDGDFYVYYSKDENEEYKIPRLAIRMEGDEISEVRGIAYEQNIESGLELILEDKLKEFADRDKYLKKLKDMSLLTKIYNSYKSRELTREELKFLYEAEGEILGFGYYKDPRIAEILDGRDLLEDFSFMYNCRKDEIGFEPEDYNGKVYYKGDIEIYESDENSISLPKFLKGSLYLNTLKTIDNLVLPNVVTSNLGFNHLISLRNKLPRVVGQSLYLNSLTSLSSDVLPDIIGDYFNLESLKTYDLIDIRLPEEVGKKVILEDGDYTLEELKRIIALKKEQRDLLQSIDVLTTLKQSEEEHSESILKKGNINLLFILIPSLIVLLGIIISSIIFYR